LRGDLFKALDHQYACSYFLSYKHQQETLLTKNQSTQSHWQSNKALLQEREFLAYVLIMCGSVGIYYCYLAGAPYVVMELRQYSATVYGTWFSVVAIGYLAGNFIAGRFSEKYGTQGMIMFSMVPLVIGVISFWAFSSSTHLIGMFLPMQFIALSNGMCLPNLTSAAMSVRTDNSGGASGLLGTLQVGTAIVLTLVVSATLKGTALPLFSAITTCGFYLPTQNLPFADHFTAYQTPVLVLWELMITERTNVQKNAQSNSRPREKIYFIYIAWQ